jgi:hypothetical protein
MPMDREKMEELKKVLQPTYDSGVTEQSGKKKRKRKKGPDSKLKSGLSKRMKKYDKFEDEDAVMPSNTAGSY